LSVKKGLMVNGLSFVILLDGSSHGVEKFRNII